VLAYELISCCRPLYSTQHTVGFLCTSRFPYSIRGSGGQQCFVADIYYKYASFDKTSIQSLNFHPRCPVTLTNSFWLGASPPGLPTPLEPPLLPFSLEQHEITTAYSICTWENIGAKQITWIRWRVDQDWQILTRWLCYRDCRPCPPTEVRTATRSCEDSTSTQHTKPTSATQRSKSSFYASTKLV